MAFIKIPSKGMRDILPEDMKIRNYLLGKIRDIYHLYGFEEISTPSVEHIENLTGRLGGENEKLIFQILKRGEKLNLEEAKDVSDLVDSGLRYDLTVPLARFYANNINDLPSPFRALQIGNVWRAERNQKGRFREFIQCDIDILGEKTNLAEIEIISGVIAFLKSLDFKDFEIRINDRALLREMIDNLGFKEYESKVLITLDKIDKIGVDSVKEELINLGLDRKNVDKLVDNLDKDLEDYQKLYNIDENIITNLKKIISIVSKETEANILFDASLVRGMGYYTGPIFEIAVKDASFAVGGGGRYDDMVSKYANISVPACGFSIGFERLCLILKERGYTLDDDVEKLAYIIEDNDKEEVIKLANEKRKEGKMVKILNKNKNYKHQVESLEKDGYKIIK